MALGTPSSSLKQQATGTPSSAAPPMSNRPPTAQSAPMARSGGGWSPGGGASYSPQTGNQYGSGSAYPWAFNYHQTTPQDQAMQLAWTQALPQWLQINQQQQQAFNQQGFANLGYGLDVAGMQQNAGYQNALLGLNQQQNALDQAGIGNQLAGLQQQLGITNSQYQNNLGYNTQQQGFIGDRYDVNSAYNQQQQQFAALAHRFGLQGFDLQERGLAHQTGRERRDLESQAVASGSYTSEGTRTGFSDISTQHKIRQGEINLARKQANLAYKERKAGLVNQLTNMGMDRNEAIAALDHARDNLLYDNQLANLSVTQQIQALQNRQQGLALVSQRYGLDAAHISQQLQQGLGQLGLQHQMTVGGLMDAVTSGDYQQQALAIQVIQQAMQIGEVIR